MVNFLGGGGGEFCNSVFSLRKMVSTPFCDCTLQFVIAIADFVVSDRSMASLRDGRNDTRRVHFLPSETFP